MYSAENLPILPEEDILFGIVRRPLLDPMGSYTGIPADPLEKPVQDADDL